MKENPDPAEKEIGRARIAVILGSGLGDVGQRHATEAALPFDDIPGLSRPEVSGHAGEIRRCLVGSTPCLFIRGRRHVYEEKADEIASLVRFVASSGVEELVVTSAAGSLLPTLRPGEFVLVERIVDLQHPLLRIPPLARTPRPESRLLELDPGMNRRLERSAISCGLPLVRATLASCTGPTYETRAEVYALQGADVTVASMSVAPEVATARALGIRVACVGLVTNWVTGITRGPLDHEHVLAAGRSATTALERLITQFIVAA